MKFAIGDRVEVISRQENFETVGLLGTVRSIAEYVGVVHDCKFDGVMI